MNFVSNPLSLGDAVYISITTPADGYEKMQIQTSGAVKLTTTPLTLSAGVNIIGNSSPSTQSIQKFKLIGALGEGAETIQPIGKTGNYVGDPYTWVKKDELDIYGVDKEGWYDSGMNLVDKSVVPGEGLYIQVTSEVGSEIPAAITK